MKLASPIALVLFSLTSFGQDSVTYVPGHIVEIHGLVLDATNDDTLVFSKLTLSASDAIVGESVADFDGGFHFRFCSNKARVDSLVLQVEELGYLKKRMSLVAETNPSLTVHLDPDTAFQITEEAKQEYLDSLHTDRPSSCGTAQYECDYKANPLFRHCDGRIESFIRLVELNERMGEWERL